MSELNTDILVKVPLTIRRGASWNLKFKARLQSDGSSYSLAGHKFLLQVRESHSSTVLFQKTSEGAQPSIVITNDEAVINGLPTDTQNLAPKDYEYDLRMEYPNGTVRYPMGGMCRILKNISR
jgi:hypothetical protein